MLMARRQVTPSGWAHLRGAHVAALHRRHKLAAVVTGGQHPLSVLRSGWVSGGWGVGESRLCGGSNAARTAHSQSNHAATDQQASSLPSCSSNHAATAQQHPAEQPAQSFSSPLLTSGEGVAWYECTKYTRRSATWLSSADGCLHGLAANRCRQQCQQHVYSVCSIMAVNQIQEEPGHPGSTNQHPTSHAPPYPCPRALTS